MSITTESIDIRCNPEDVYVFVTSPQHQLEINDSAREIRGYDGESLQIGDQWVVILNFMGRDIESTYTLLEAQPPTKLIYDNRSNAATIQITWYFEEVDTGTRVTFHSATQSSGIVASLIFRLVKGQFDKNVRQSLQNMKRRLEANG